MGRSRILIVEDEPKVATLIKRGLEENLYEADIAPTAETSLNLLRTSSYDLILLDLGLPDISGYDLCKRIRKDDLSTPVLMLTAFGSTDDKLNGFECGADDYLVKPFEFRELVARIRVLIRRSAQQTVMDELIKVSDLEMDMNAKVVKRGGVPVDLTAKEFSLLELLMRNKGKVISRMEIAEKIWDINFDTGTNVIDVYINFLRKKIDKGHAHKLIHTYIGMGYSLKEPE